MKYTPKLWLPALALALAGALSPSGGLWAQQASAAPASTEAIDQLTGPIALYPDALVIQVLTASKDYPAVQSFAGWLEKNASLKGTELQDAAQKAGFSESLVGLALFPQVIQTMVQKPDWTKALGQAVTADQKAVADSVQRLRAQAQALGNLKTTPQQVVVVTNVIVEKTVEERVVVVTNTIVEIQPANPQVIYVPTYPQTVYVQQAPPPSAVSTTGAALLGFTVGVIVGANNSHYHHGGHGYWSAREDYYQDRQDNARQNQDQRQDNSQARQGDRQGNQDQRQTDRQGNQDQRQSGAQANQGQRQSTAQASQGQRQSGTASAQSQGAAGKSQGKSTATASSRSGGQTATKSSAAGSKGSSGYQSGSATKAQSSRGSASVSSSRSGGGKSASGGRSGGGGRSSGGRGR